MYTYNKNEIVLNWNAHVLAFKVFKQFCRLSYLQYCSTP